MFWSEIAILLGCLTIYVQAHGRLMNPPSRGALWRMGYDSPRDFDDSAMNCGGFARQHITNGGKCGICGDPYDEPKPRAHELGGTFGIGYIVANYKQGQVIPTSTIINALHNGYWELRICPDHLNQEQECFDNGYLLELEDGGNKYYPSRGPGEYNLTYVLPSGLTCKHCVLQWQYTSCINWGVCRNGTTGLHCGKQEHFLTCSDISIGDGVDSKHQAVDAKKAVSYDANMPTQLSSMNRRPYSRFSRSVPQRPPYNSLAYSHFKF